MTITRTIAGRTIGAGHTPLIIAELGVNHDGDRDCALVLVDHAHDAGADAIKTQVFDADLLMSSDARLAAYQRQSGENNPVDMLRRLQLSLDALEAIHERAHELGLLTLCTIFTPELVAPTLESVRVDALKIASPDIVNTLLLDACIETGLPLILSTGASIPEEIDDAITHLGPARDRVSLMQCVSAYPTPDRNASLGAIRDIARRTNLPVGYSDHTTSTLTGAIAVGAGACLLEKHLTHDRDAPGPDHSASLDPNQLSEYVTLARGAFSMLGQESKSLLDIERDVRDVSRQSLVLRTPCARGQTITRTMLSSARPGTGIAPNRVQEIVGMVATCDLEAGTLLQPEHAAPAHVTT
ncbi:MAG: N-acetylneuraminate synthase family protein [Phycisphaerales bacterium JB043]